MAGWLAADSSRRSAEEEGGLHTRLQCFTNYAQPLSEGNLLVIPRALPTPGSFPLVFRRPRLLSPCPPSEQMPCYH